MIYFDLFKECTLSSRGIFFPVHPKDMKLQFGNQGALKSLHASAAQAFPS